MHPYLSEEDQQKICEAVLCAAAGFGVVGAEKM
jgi:hypothetical protein